MPVMICRHSDIALLKRSNIDPDIAYLIVNVATRGSDEASTTSLDRQCGMCRGSRCQRSGDRIDQIGLVDTPLLLDGIHHHLGKLLGQRWRVLGVRAVCHRPYTAGLIVVTQRQPPLPIPSTMAKL